MFDRLGPEMAERGNRVITIDLLGHGRSDRPPEMSHYSMTFFAAPGRGAARPPRARAGGDRRHLAGRQRRRSSSAYLAPERVRGMMVEMPVLDNALLAAARDLHPDPARRCASASRCSSGSPSAASRIPRTNPLLDIGLDWIRQDPAPSSAVLEGLFLGVIGAAPPVPRADGPADAGDRPPRRPASPVLGLRHAGRGAARTPG